MFIFEFFIIIFMFWKDEEEEEKRLGWLAAAIATCLWE